MNVRKAGFPSVCGGLVWVAMVTGSAPSATADEFFLALNNPFSAKETGTWTVRRGGHWVVTANPESSPQSRDVTIADPLEIYRDPRDGYYYFPLPPQRVGSRTYTIRDFGLTSPRPRDWKQRNAPRAVREIGRSAVRANSPPARAR